MGREWVTQCGGNWGDWRVRRPADALSRLLSGIRRRYLALLSGQRHCPYRGRLPVGWIDGNGRVPGTTGVGGVRIRICALAAGTRAVQEGPGRRDGLRPVLPEPRGGPPPPP